MVEVQGNREHSSLKESLAASIIDKLPYWAAEHAVRLALSSLNPISFTETCISQNKRHATDYIAFETRMRVHHHLVDQRLAIPHYAHRKEDCALSFELLYRVLKNNIEKGDYKQFRYVISTILNDHHQDNYYLARDYLKRILQLIISAYKNTNPVKDEEPNETQNKLISLLTFFSKNRLIEIEDYLEQISSQAIPRIAEERVPELLRNELTPGKINKLAQFVASVSPAQQLIMLEQCFPPFQRFKNGNVSSLLDVQPLLLQVQEKVICQFLIEKLRPEAIRVSNIRELRQVLRNLNCSDQTISVATLFYLARYHQSGDFLNPETENGKQVVIHFADAFEAFKHDYQDNQLLRVQLSRTAESILDFFHQKSTQIQEDDEKFTKSILAMCDFLFLYSTASIESHLVRFLSLRPTALNILLMHIRQHYASQILKVLDQENIQRLQKGEVAKFAPSFENKGDSSEEPFSYDLSSTENYATEHWTVRQCIIDLLQNHLDACAFSYCKQLVQVAYGETSEVLSDSMIRGYLNPIWTFVHLFPSFPEHNFRIPNIQPADYPALYEKLKTVPHVKPKVEVLVSLEGTNTWIDHELFEMKKENLLGVRFSDNGLGYDPKLIAEYLPTKTDWFRGYRGTFGQGAKISMIYLRNLGANITFGSSYYDWHSAQHHSWNARPTLGSNRSVWLTGHEKSQQTRPSDLPSGSYTEIIFDRPQMIDSFFPISNLVTDYSEHQFSYLTPDTELQVSRSNLATKHYVQGLYVSELNNGAMNTLFSYSFPKDVLSGRDRRHITGQQQITHHITRAWSDCVDVDLLRTYYGRMFSTPSSLEEEQYLSGNAQHAEALKKYFEKISPEKVIICSDSDQLPVEVRLLLSMQPKESPTWIAVGLQKPAKQVADLVEKLNKNFELPMFYSPNVVLESLTEEKDQSQQQYEILLEKGKQYIKEAIQLVASTFQFSEEQKTFLNKSNWDINFGHTTGSISFNEKSNTFTISVDRDYISQDVSPNITEEKSVERVRLSILLSMISVQSLLKKESSFNTIRSSQHEIERLNHKRPEAHIFTIDEVDLSQRASPQEYVTKNDLIESAVRALVLQAQDSRITHIELGEIASRLNQIVGYSDESSTIFPLLESLQTYSIPDNGEYYIISFNRDQKKCSVEMFSKETLFQSEVFSVDLVGDHPQSRLYVTINNLARGDTITFSGSPPIRLEYYNDEVNDSFSGFTSKLFDHSFFYRGILIIPIGVDNSQLITQYKNFFQTTSLKRNPDDSNQEEENFGIEELETSIGIEYGKGIWENPIRLLSDILQNHLDAGKVVEEYQVKTAKGNVWMTKEELITFDGDAPIVGMRFSDDGAGYSTRGTFMLGEETKTSTGKRGRYGEAIKLLAASAVRSKWKFRLLSRNWEASAKEKIVNRTVEGSTRPYKKLSYEMKWANQNRNGSATEILLDSTDSQSISDWKALVTIADPRNRVQQHRGLERYILDLRENQPSICHSPKLAMIDEPEITLYERGLIIPTQQKLPLMFSYHVFAHIIDTQERNHVNFDILKALIIEMFQTQEIPLSVIVKILQQVHLLNVPVSELQQYPEFLGLLEIPNSKLRIAFQQAFGDSGVLSGRPKHGDSLQSTDPQTAFIANILCEYEEKYFPEAIRSPIFQVLHDAGIPSVDDLILWEKLSIEIGEEKLNVFEHIAQTVAKDLVSTMQNNLSRIGSMEALLPFFSKHIKSLQSVSDLKLWFSTFFGNLEDIASGKMPVTYRFFSSVNSHGYANTKLNEIGMSIQILPQLTTTLEHELIHIASKISDYNFAFSLLLLLRSPFITTLLPTQLSEPEHT